MAIEGRNLTQEIDELKALVEQLNRENFELKKLVKEKDNPEASKKGVVGWEERPNPETGKKVTVGLEERPPGYDDEEWIKWQSAHAFHDFEKAKIKEELEEKFGEQLKSLKGPSPYGPMGIKELCLSPNISLPKDFKVPEFQKFDGGTHPIMHLKMYCTKMGIWSQDENFLISFFPESLEGAAWEWYMQLDRSRIKCWEDLAIAFTNQYKFNLNAAPTREHLKTLKKENKETFKQYAQRWRSVAARVVPSMMESEMCSYFIRTLDGPFFKNMLGTHVKEFVDLVEIGERIESNIQDGKIEVEEASKKAQPFKKKEGGVNSIQPTTFTSPYSSPYQYLPTSPYYPVPYQVSNTQYPRPYTPPFTPFSQPSTQFDPRASRPQAPVMPNNILNPRPPMNNRPLPDFHMSNKELFNKLCAERLITPRMGKPMVPPFPRWFNPNVACEYHSNVPGHSLENCYAFRGAVWKLLDDKTIEIREEKRPDVQNNPLPSYGNKQVNAVGFDCDQATGLENTSFSMKEILEGLKMVGYKMVRGTRDGETYEVKSGEKLACNCKEQGHTHDIESCPEFKKRVDRLFKLGVLRIPAKKEGCWTEINALRSEPLVFKVPAQKPALVFHTPSPFPYQDNRAVPWRYDTVVETTTKEMPESVTNITGIGGVTRSGRCYAPHQSAPHQSKEVKDTADGKRPNVEENDEEFLKIMKQSEYDVVEQLKKTPAKISLYTLILTSEAHRNALKKVLDQSFVNKDITPERVENLVNMIRANSVITFTEDEIAPDTSGRPRALYITLKCEGYIVSKVLIDGGSALNVLPYGTLLQLPIDPATVEPTNIMVRAFDGSPRNVLGKICLKLGVGPNTFITEFQVMDIGPSYNMLLGRPWIHAAGAVPSTLHQRLKYISDGKIITVKGEEGILLSKPVAIPYIDSSEHAIETSFQSLEIVDLEEDKGEVNQVVARMLYAKGFQKGKGLGAHLQGIKDPISLPVNEGKLGLGYVDEGSRAAKTPKEGGIPHIRSTFPAPAEIVALDSDVQDSAEDSCMAIRPSREGEQLDNWESEAIFELMYLE